MYGWKRCPHERAHTHTRTCTHAFTHSHPFPGTPRFPFASPTLCPAFPELIPDQNSAAHATAQSLVLRKEETWKNRRGIGVFCRVSAGKPCGRAQGMQSCQHTLGSQKPHLPSSLREREQRPRSLRCSRLTARALSPPCHPAADLQPRKPSEHRLSPLLAFNRQLPHLGEKVPVGVVMIKGVIQGSSDIHTQLWYNS